MVLSHTFESSHQNIIYGTKINQLHISISFNFARDSLVEISRPLLRYSPVGLLFGGSSENVVDSLIALC